MKRKPGFKLKFPFVGLWVVTDGRLRAGYHHRYEQGYLDGLAAGRAPVTPANVQAGDLPPVRPHRQRLSSGPEVGHDVLTDATAA
jgi:hypothetical protein